MNEPTVTYAHKDGGSCRFRQLKKDPLPAWAVDVRDELDLTKVHDVEVDGIDTRDYPDFSDAYISFATYDGVPMTDEQLEELNNHSDFVYEHVQRSVF